MRIENPKQLVGNTPIVKVGEYGGSTIWAKLEGTNVTGSLKDRTAYALVQAAIEKGLPKTTPLLDASSGSFATALAFHGKRAGFPVTVVVNEKISEDNLGFLRALQADIIRHGKVTGEGRQFCNEKAENEPNGWHFIDQLTNPVCPEVHELTTAKEIFQDLPEVDTIVASKGSGATLLGLARYLKQVGSDTKLFGSVGIPGDEKKVAGTYVEGADFVSPFILELDAVQTYIDDVPVRFREAMTSCLELLAAGVIVGPQGGGVYTAAKRLVDGGSGGRNILIIAGDTFLKNVSRF